ncbi:hypothetical protein HY989_05365 [Candidatus Micrarchaeota archaeon]|nr:hypothetical protein [Candidatus Micrarchaeota archaeon]
MDDEPKNKRKFKEVAANKFFKEGDAKIDPATWIPKLNEAKSVLEKHNVGYALFGAPAVAAHNVQIRPTKDVDIVVKDNKIEVAELLAGELKMLYAHKIKPDEDAELVIDLPSKIFFEIWENKLYTVPMTEESWKSVRPTAMGYAISREDLIASKVGRYLQSNLQKDTDLNDIVATLLSSKDLDYSYLTRRLIGGERREKVGSGTAWNLSWFFIRELPEYYRALLNLSNEQKARETLTDFTSNVISRLTTKEVEHQILAYCKKNSTTMNELQKMYFLNASVSKLLLKKWAEAKVIELKDEKILVSKEKMHEYFKRDKTEPTGFAKDRLIKNLNAGYRNLGTLASLSGCSKQYVYMIAKKMGIKLHA